MNIALVGGIERNEAELTQIARRAGHTLEYHGGHIGGRGADGLRALIERARLPTEAPPLEPNAWLELMSRDKKVDAGAMRFVVLEALGRAAIRRDITSGQLTAVLAV